VETTPVYVPSTVLYELAAQLQSVFEVPSNGPVTGIAPKTDEALTVNASELIVCTTLFTPFAEAVIAVNGNLTPDTI
jgi:hypothetical protein